MLDVLFVGTLLGYAAVLLLFDDGNARRNLEAVLTVPYFREFATSLSVGAFAFTLYAMFFPTLLHSEPWRMPLRQRLVRVAASLMTSAFACILVWTGTPWAAIGVLAPTALFLAYDHAFPLPDDGPPRDRTPPGEPDA